MKIFAGSVEFGFSGNADGNLDFRFDDTEVVNKRREKFFTREKINPKSSVVMIAEHKNRAFEILRKDAGRGVASGKDQYVCDMLITHEKDCNLILSVADCIALALYNPKNEILAMVHVGSKNLAIGTVGKAVEAIKKSGHFPSVVPATHVISACQESDKRPARIYAATGPFIKKCCYSFDKIPDYLSNLKNYFTQEDNHYFFDTETALKDQLLASGIQEEHISISGLCSKHDGFPSHKRSQEESLPESRMLVYARMV